MKKILTMFGVMLIILFTLTINVNAYTYGIGLTPAKTMLKKGDTVTVDIMISSLALESGEAGIIGLEAELDYDSTVFSKASVSGNGQWSEGENITKVKGIFFSNEVKEPGKLATITLTVADSAKLGETTVTLKNIKTANGTAGEVTSNNALAKFTVVEVVDNGNTDNGNVPGTGDNSGNEDDNTGAGDNQGNGNENTGVGDNQGNGNGNTGAGDNQGNGNDNTGAGNNQGNGNDNTGTGDNKENGNDNTTAGDNKENENDNKVDNTTNNKNNTAKDNTANTNKDNTIANKVISAAGLENFTAIVVGTLVVIAGISYMSYKRYKNM